MMNVRFSLFSLWLLSLSACSPALRAQAPEWIWLDHKGAAPAENERAFFRKVIVLADRPRAAALTLACDNEATVLINGNPLAENTDWNQPMKVSATKDLRAGENTLAVRAKNAGGPAGLLVKLELSFADGQKQIIVSDSSWQASAKEADGWTTPTFAANGWAKPASLGNVGVQPWGAVLANAATKTPSTAPREATPAESLKVPDGFKVELLRSAQPGEGSWVALTTDPKGRLIMSPQGGEPVLRLTLDPSGHIAKMETIDLPVRGAMGLLYAFDSLYVNGRGPNGYHLYRLRDTDGDDQYDKIELLRKWNGNKGGDGEHGAHGIVLGQDKKLYIVCGNFVDVPQDILPTSPHRNYADDVLLPRMEDGNGFGAGRKPPGGYVLRMDADGNNAELFASGERNTYDIAFNPEGELFAFDSDMEWDWGMPWYRPIRVTHIVSGADHGFREGSAKWPTYYPDSLPPIVDIGIGSPTGVEFGTGAKFPPKYQRALYVMDWSYGRIVATHLKENGASYTGTWENFVVGKPLNVTDLVIGKDGAMYFATGGRGTQAGLYRVSYVGPKDPGQLIDAYNEKQSREPRALRHKLEAFHGKHDPQAIDFAWPHLDSPDRSIRYAARLAIESQPVGQWQQRALDESRQRASLTALLALARVGPSDVQDKLLESFGRSWPGDLNEEQKLEALRVCQVCLVRMGRPSEGAAKDLIKELDAVYPATSWPLNRELSTLLIYLEAPGVVKKTIGLLTRAETQEEQIHYLVQLRNLKTGWTMEERKTYFSWFNRPRETVDGGPTYPGGASYTIVRNTKHPATTVQWFRDVRREYGDGASFPKFIANLRNSAIASLSDEERSELAALIAAQSAAQTAAKTRTYKFVKEWTMADLAPALDQVSKGRNFERGKEAFVAAQCLACHRFGNEGGANGPDITAVTSRFTRADILSSIVEPSKVVSEQYQNTTVFKKDGDDVTGRLLEETDAKLVLLTDALKSTKVDVKKSDVQERRPSKLSPMPEGLVNILAKEEILDLLAYIESAGRKDHAAFRKN
jgi:putative heme-binding domain-containing protein